MTLTQANILNALRSVKDPDLHRDIVALGFVKDVNINGKDVQVTVELTTPACPVRDELKHAAAQAIKSQIEEVGTVNVQMTSRVTRHENGQKELILPAVKNTIAVASGKGGVGKSTVAVNLASALARDGATVGLMDADIYGPSIPLMMGVRSKPTMRDKKIVPLENWGVKVMSIGFFVEPMQAMIWRGPMVSGAVKQFLSDVHWGDLDYLVIDLPPGTGDIQLTLVQTIPLTGAVLVTTPQDVSLADVRKGYALFEKVNVPVLGIIENMSYYVCSHCGTREEIFNHGGGRRAAEELGVPFLGEIPLYTRVRVSGDTGIPVVCDPATKEQGDVFMAIARNMAARVSIRNAAQAAPVDIQL